MGFSADAASSTLHWHLAALLLATVVSSVDLDRRGLLYPQIWVTCIALLAAISKLQLDALALLQLPAWLLLALVALDDEVRLCCGLLLVLSPQVPKRVTALFLTLWLASCTLATEFASSFLHFSWVPIVVFLYNIRHWNAMPADPNTVSQSARATEQASEAVEADSSAREALALLDRSDDLRHVNQATVHGLNLAKFAAELLSEEWGENVFLVDLYRRQGGTEVCALPWIDALGTSSSSSTSRVRQVHLKAPCPPAPGCPRTTRIELTFRMCTPASWKQGDPLDWLRLDLSVNSMDIPWGSTFRIQEQIELRTANRAVEVKKLYRNNFIQNIGFFSSVIVAATGVEQGKSFPALVAALESKADVSKKAPKESSDTVLQIWELQRRSFFQDWQAPFLEGDGAARWRWVDSSYEKHAWTRPLTPEAAATAMVPPVTPDRSWMPLNEWSVSKECGDEDGWQYAVNFLQDDWWWTSTCFSHPVRRRLWTRKFVKVTSAQQSRRGHSDVRTKVFSCPRTQAICLGAAGAVTSLACAALTLHHVF
eukprot:CAMPEP_0197665426 /NCGR_PEP_ID=MMETSP1338-20131121/59220_1 /TAXON_ID=43686 ORGANISM="Pelagodinium beii, Strain RCC1491" /NCGR_SAMPLE_ID=MMETSP1338 /ASSEMBLY_ACC=CAM_ASM_000754 /LENGTH=538 /DNA_ID=CAMNT_0043244229 /DNA_START=40 /DNA_END=1656 /DNA_ORIENTATION=-